MKNGKTKKINCLDEGDTMVSSGVLVWKLRHLRRLLRPPTARRSPAPLSPSPSCRRRLPPTTAKAAPTAQPLSPRRPPASDDCLRRLRRLLRQPSPSLPVALLPPTTASDLREGCSEGCCEFFEDAEQSPPTPLHIKNRTILKIKQT